MFSSLSVPTKCREAGFRERRRLAELGLAISPTPVVRGRDDELASIGVRLDRVRAGAVGRGGGRAGRGGAGDGQDAPGGGGGRGRAPPRVSGRRRCGRAGRGG